MPGFWRRISAFARPGRAEQLAAPPAPARFTLNAPLDLIAAMTAGGLIDRPISRREALQVPAMLRARNLICASIGSLPIRVHAPDRSLATGQYLVPNPDPQIPHSVVMTETIEDLFFDAISWWRVTARGAGGWPVEAQHVPLTSVTVRPSATTPVPPSRQLISPDSRFPLGGQVYIDDVPMRDIDVIRFDSPNPPILVHAARAIRTVLLLDNTAATYANEPFPLGYFAPRDPGAEEATDEEIEAVLDKWESDRKKRAWGYVNAALEAKQLQLNPEQLQLAAARQHAVLEIARATGIDPEELGVSTTSRTYANEEQRDQAKLKYTFGAYVAAVEQRLSMRDVLPAGFESKIDLSGFLRSDEKTRMETYQIGLQVGAYADEDEVRAREGKPKLTPAQRTARSKATAPAEPAAANNTANGGARAMADVIPIEQRRSANFEAGEPVRVQFEAPAPQDFQVDTSRRTITGLLLPWGKVANNGFAKWRFLEGSVSWNEDAVSRVKLNLHHDSTDLIGVATRLQSGSRGLMGTFKVGRGAEGDRALEKAEDLILDGFSVEVMFDSFDSWQPDPTDESVRLVRQSTLTGVALTGTPAFDDARVASVKAERQGSKSMGAGSGTASVAAAAAGTGNGAQPQGIDFEGFMGDLADSLKTQQQQLVESLGQSVGESLSAGVKAALEGMTGPQDGPQPVRAARYTVTREAPIYSLNGAGPSLVRDGWYACMHRDGDALERLRKFRMQTEDLAKLTNAELRRQMFATITTGTAAAVIPPGYRPDLFVPMLAQGRPMVSALSRGLIENATPFVVPVFGSVTGATADHVEGTNPTDGTLTMTTKTVTPGAVSGSLVLTREIVDSSNPAIDQIALNAMLESYNRQTEAKVYTLLNGASGAGGVITNGLVPSGAQAATFASTGGTPFAEALLIKGMRQQLAKYPFVRFAAPQVALMGQNATSILAGTMDSTGRPIFPSIGAENSSGLGNAVQQGWSVDGLPFIPAWAMTGVAAGDSQMLILNPLDGWAWESPLLTFRFEEKQGPAKIELDLFGYFATHLLRPSGLSGIRIT